MIATAAELGKLGRLIEGYDAHNPASTPGCPTVKPLELLDIDGRKVT